MKTVTHPVCEGCGKELLKPSEGCLITGAIYPAYLPAEPELSDIIVGGWIEEQDGTYPDSQVWCQKCLISKLVDTLDGLRGKDQNPGLKE